MPGECVGKSLAISSRPLLLTALRSSRTRCHSLERTRESWHSGRIQLSSMRLMNRPPSVRVQGEVSYGIWHTAVQHAALTLDGFALSNDRRLTRLGASQRLLWQSQVAAKCCMEDGEGTLEGVDGEEVDDQIEQLGQWPRQALDRGIVPDVALDEARVAAVDNNMTVRVRS